ncbi:uncharacterized protein BKA78DRAFT_39311 [Phyllosticta capitalensis]|uniref:uncharacterized protein n=1 Tax=Phyllosticta capitalensis TaxID=121624 RepID=UPI00312EEF5E
MKLTKWCGVVLLAAPALTQETQACDCSASTVTLQVTVTGPTVTVTLSSCPDSVSAAPAAVSSTKPYICAGDPCTSWVDNHSPDPTDILTFKPTTVTRFPVPPSAVSATPTIYLTSTRTKTHTVKTRTTITVSTTDGYDEDPTSSITAAPVTQTIPTSEEPEPTTTTTELSTVTERATITFTHGSATVVTTVNLSDLTVSSHHHSFTGFGNHGWNLTSSTARLNGTAQPTYPRPSYGAHPTPSAKWHTVTLPWTAPHNASSAHPHKTTSVESISWDLEFSTPTRSHNKTSSAKPHKTSSVESISWDLGPDTSIFPLETTTNWATGHGTPTHHHKTSSHSWNLQFSSTPITHIPSAVHHTSSHLTTPYANTTTSALVKRIVTAYPTDCPVPEEEHGNFTFFVSFFPPF